MFGWLFPKTENTSIKPEEIKQYMQPVQELIDLQGGTAGQMQRAYGQSMGFAEDMMDPMSVRNLQQRRLMEQQGNQSLALQNLLARRQAAALGQESGITQAQQRGATTAMARDINQQWQQGLNQQYMQGLGQFNQGQGLLGQIAGLQSGMASQQMGIQENIAQADIARRQQAMALAEARKNRTSSFWGGMLGGAASGFGSFAGGAASEGGLWNQ